jgi:hypothetical protein
LPFLRQLLVHFIIILQKIVCCTNRNQLGTGRACPLPSLPYFQSDFSSAAMTRSGLSLEELRIVEGQGQSSEVISPPEEVNRMNDLGA